MQQPLTGLFERRAEAFQDPAFALNRIVPIHRWVPWIAGYSQAFAADAINKFAEGPGKLVLDPFAGVGTTLIEADWVGHRAVGFEINPYAAFAAKLKLSAHRLDTRLVRATIRRLREFGELCQATGINAKSKPPAGFKTRSSFYSPNVLRKVLLVMDFIEREKRDKAEIADVVRLVFAATMISYSNYSYEPSLSRRVSAGKD